MNIEIKHLSTGRWRVRIGLIEKEFLSVEMAVEMVKAKMDEAEDSWIASQQNTSGT